jgi:dTDP-4-dehydrorhamnose reductase
MRVLILGGLGMVGHRLWIALSAEHEVWGTVRNDAAEVPALPSIDRARICDHVDMARSDERQRVFERVRPEVVINCVGLVKQRPEANEDVPAITINALVPHEVAELCRATGARMVHISTDCVFSGRAGNYTEDDQPDPEDLYGRTKLVGEVVKGNAITLRTSFIGRELRTRQGLTEWFLAQRGQVRGYKRSVFSGLTTHAFARAVMQHVLPHPELHGLYHVSSAPITKYELLDLMKRCYGRDVEIVPDAASVCDRSLDSTRFRKATGFRPVRWEDMVQEMASDPSPQRDEVTERAFV